MRRRNFLVAFGLAGAGYATWRVASRFWPPSFEFEPIPHLPGFRRIAAGEISRGRSPLIGLADGGGAADDARKGRGAPDICDALFGDQRYAQGIVRVVYFSDFNCPICRVMSEELIELKAAMNGAMHVIWRELPLLGEQSARAAIAAGRQGAYLAAHRRLMRSRFQVTPAYLRSLSESLDLEWEKFLADFESTSTLKEIEGSLRAAKMLGFYGTPGIVIERTTGLGYLDTAQVTALVAIERNEVDEAPCA